MTPRHVRFLVTLMRTSMSCKIKEEMNKLLEKAKKLNIPRRNLMKKDELEQAIKDTISRYKDLIYGNDVVCENCLREIYKQEKIDKKMYFQRLFEQGIRDLCCQYCQHTRTIIEGERVICDGCGTVLQESEVSYNGDYSSRGIKKR